jgi:hypothetical protein
VVHGVHGVLPAAAMCRMMHCGSGSRHEARELQPREHGEYQQRGAYAEGRPGQHRRPR